jgi:hypothetical protein
MYEGALRMAYQQTVVAQYRCDYDAQHRSLQDVCEPYLYATPFASAQLELLELDDTQWRKFLRRPLSAVHRRRAMVPEQLSWLELGTFTLLWALKAL